MILLRASLLAAVAVVSASASHLVFDSYTNASNLTFTGSTPREYIGMRFDVGDPGPSVDIVGATFYMLSGTTASYTDIQLQLEFWNTYNGAASPVFSNSAGGVQTFDVGPASVNASNYYIIPVTFATPIHLTGLTNLGIAVNYKGNTGAGLADTNNLTSLLRDGNAFAVGSSQTSSYFRAASRTDLNFDSGDAKSLGQPYQGLAMQLYAADPIPEPGTFVLAAGALALLAAKFRRR